MRDTTEQRDNILRHAALKLATRGFGNTRLRDIAKSAGVSIGMVQHHFETRDQLLIEAFEWSIDNLLIEWHHTVDVGDDAWQTLQALIGTLTADPDLARRSATWVEFCISASRYPELTEGVQRVYRTWRELIRRLVLAGVAEGIFSPALPVDQAARILSTLVDGCDVAMSTGAGVMSPEQYRQLLLDAALVVLNVEVDAV